MRIISGSLKGRVIQNKRIEGTRPTMDRVKESLFAMISSSIENSVFLDLFAGSGSIGIEAISNGARKCYFVDKNKLCTKDIENTVNKFLIKEKAEIFTLDYKKALETFKEKKIKFDIIFLDPPYKEEQFYEEVLLFVIEHEMLNQNGLFICEASSSQFKENYQDLEQIKNKKYGDKYIVIYKRNK